MIDDDPPSINSIIRWNENNLQVLCNDGSGLFQTFTPGKKYRVMTIKFHKNHHIFKHYIVGDFLMEYGCCYYLLMKMKFKIYIGMG